MVQKRPLGGIGSGIGGGIGGGIGKGIGGGIGGGIGRGIGGGLKQPTMTKATSSQPQYNSNHGITGSKITGNTRGVSAVSPSKLTQ